MTKVLGMDAMASSINSAISTGAIEKQSSLEETHIKYLQFLHLGLLQDYITVFACCFESDDGDHYCSAIMVVGEEDVAALSADGFELLSGNDMYMLIAAHLQEQYELGAENTHMQSLVSELDFGGKEDDA